MPNRQKPGSSGRRRWGRRHRIEGRGSVYWDDLDDGPPEVIHKWREVKDLPIRHFLKVRSVESRTSNSRRTFEELLEFRLTRIKDAKRPDVILERVFDELLGRLMNTNEFRGPPRFIGLQFINKHMDTAFFVPLRPPQQNTPEVLAATLVALNRQSGGKLRLFRTKMQCKICAVWPRTTIPEAKSWGRKRKKKTKTLGGFLAVGQRRPSLRSLIAVNNADGACLLRSIAILLVRAEFGPASAQFRRVKNNTFHAQDHAAARLGEAAGIQPGHQQYGLKEAKAVQRYLQRRCPARFRLLIFDWERLGKLIYKGKWPAKHQLALLLHNGHFEPLTRPAELFKTRGTFCPDCQHVAYKNSHFPKCPAACGMCYRFGLGYPCMKARHQKNCDKCGFFFPNADCFSHHRKKGVAGGKSICQQRFHCPDCGNVIFARARKHKCAKDEVENLAEKCSKCCAIHGDGSRCYIQPTWFLEEEALQPKEEKKKPHIRFCFYDIETTQQRRMMIGNLRALKHEANLLVAEIICKECADKGISPTAPIDERADGCRCGVHGPRFRFKKQAVGENRRLLAFHNFDNNNNKNADCPMEEFLDFMLNHGPQNTVTILIAHNAGKFDMHILLEKIYALGLAPELLMTGLKIYSATLGGSNRRRLIFKDSLNYLTGALSGLYDTFELGSAEGISKKPFFPHYFNKRANLNRELDCLPPARYYGPKEMKEGALREFVSWYAANRAQPFLLRDALLDYCINDVRLLREACLRFRRIILGICEEVEPFESANTMAKLALNIWRTKFLQPNSIVQLEGPLNLRQQQSVGALRFFKFLSRLLNRPIRTAEWNIGEFPVPDCGFRVDGMLGQRTAVEYLGCFFHGGCKNCYQNRLTKLAGGKTAEELFEATRERSAVLGRQGLRVFEVWECQFKELLRKRAALKTLYDKCFVAPPLDARLHALRGGRVEPFRLFDHCAPDETIEHFDIVWHWPEEAWKTGIFADYINAFLKMKVESSGWPAHLKTPEQKRDFVYAYMTRELLEIDPALIRTNKGLRHICKLLLNSLWGKLCQRANNSRVVLTKSAAEFQEIFSDDMNEVLDFTHLNSKLDRVVYRRKEEFLEAPSTNAVHIAVFVTSHARRRLFARITEAVERGLDLLYCDTDSLLFKRKCWQDPIEEGEFLGDMTNENPGRSIRSFVAAGPKNYAYVHTDMEGGDRRLVSRIRGFELTYHARARLNFRRILAMVYRKYGWGNDGNRPDGPWHVRIPYTKFGRHKLGFVYTGRTHKRYQPVYEKGVIGTDLTCRPYGWKANEGEED